MSDFFDYLYRYSLHDCKLYDIKCERNKLILIFDAGVYELNIDAKQSRLTSKCYIEIDFENNSDLNIYSHIDIDQRLHKKNKEIDFEIFKNHLKKGCFDVDMHFYSRFCNTILLTGYIKRTRYDIKVSDIKQINFLFNP